MPAVFLAARVSAPFFLARPAQELPPLPRRTPRGPRPSPFPPSFQRGFPAATGATDFPAGYVGSGEESCPELPPGPGVWGLDGVGRGMGARLLGGTGERLGARTWTREKGGWAPGLGGLR